MDSNSEDWEYKNLEDALPQDMVHYKVSYSHGRNTNEVSWAKHVLCFDLVYLILCYKYVKYHHGCCIFNTFDDLPLLRWIMIKRGSSIKRGRSGFVVTL